ncbi:uncharacterized protein LOC141665650 [Apium graveolens]|uniref:uncharacterized protein LOC141665650 n=1 Tax=Apium graveolens TaxID=4045 RepID=UPI003D791B32
MSSFGIKAAVSNLLIKWRKAQDEKLCDVSHTRRSIAVSKWEKPQQNWVKINIDAALFEDIGYVGMGSIVRGADGQFLLAHSVRREGMVPPREAEALSLKEALSWLKDKDFRRCIFETDSQVLAKAYNSVTGRSYFATIVRDCMDLFHHYDEVDVCFTRRSANSAAHSVRREDWVCWDGEYCSRSRWPV